MLSATRSNPIRQLGCLADAKQLNDSVFRASNLNIIIAGNGIRMYPPSLKAIFEGCGFGDNGTKLMTVLENRNSGPDDIPYVVRTVDTTRAVN